MSQFLIYLKVEKYLAEWLINESGGSQPVILKRGSSESDILENYLKCCPMEDRTDEVSPSEATVSIAIPSFRDKDPRYYNYLPRRGRAALERNIYVRFRIQMWEELHRLKNVECPISDLIWAWMEKHGISDEPKNWETIRQMYYRMRKLYSKPKAPKNDKNRSESEPLN